MLVKVRFKNEEFSLFFNELKFAKILSKVEFSLESVSLSLKKFYLPIQKVSKCFKEKKSGFNDGFNFLMMA